METQHARKPFVFMKLISTQLNTFVHENIDISKLYYTTLAYKMKICAAFFLIQLKPDFMWILS